MSVTTLFLLCGLPGAGKTTLAKRLAPQVPAARLCPDEWMSELGIDLFDEPFRARLESAMWHHAQELLAHGQSVILEFGFWSYSEREDKRLAARTAGYRIELHYLGVPLEQLESRLANRSGSVTITRDLLENYAMVFQAPAAGELALFDPPREV